MYSSVWAADNVDMSTQPRHVSPQQFTQDEKQLLIDYLCQDCKPVPGGNYPSAPAQTASVDCSEYMDHGLYAYFMARFVGLLNYEDVNYKMARMSMRRLWEDNALPKCQMTALCQYVRLGLETDRIPVDEKTYSSYLSDTRDQVKTAIDEFRKLKFLLLQEQEFAASRFSFQKHNDEVLWIIDLAEDCLKAAQEIRNIRRANFNVRTRTDALFAIRKKACEHALIHVHKGRGIAQPYDLSRILAVLHEAIAGRFPSIKVCSRYDKDNLEKELERLKENYTQKTLQNVEQGIEAIRPGALDLDNESWTDATQTPKSVDYSAGCSEILSLSHIHQDYRKSSDKDVFADKL